MIRFLPVPAVPGPSLQSNALRRSPTPTMPVPNMVGRDYEIARILELYKQVEVSIGSTVLIRGSGGIGKSRLADFVLERTASMGALRLIGRASRFDAGIPYAMVSEFLGSAGNANLAVESQVQELQLLLSPRKSERGINHRDNRAKNVLGLTTSLLRELAVTTPIVILCDDLHLADADSVALFAMLSRQLSHSRILFIATLRNQADYKNRDLDRMIEQFQSDNRNAVIDLHPLGKSEIHSIINGLLATSPSDDLVSTVVASSNGNPFFAIESTRLLLDSNRIQFSNSAARLIPGDQLPHAETAIIHRFFEIGSSDTLVARVLSSFRRISLRHLPLIATILKFEEDDIARSFDRLTAAQILTPIGDHEFQFAHSILRDALYDDIGPAEQRRIHQLIADYLMNERDRGVIIDISELATHMAESADPGDRTCAAILAQAGHSASSTAPLVAAQWFSRAASFVPAQSQDWAELLALEARWLFIASRPRESAQVALRALSVLEHSPQRSRTLADTVNCLYISGQLEAAISLIDNESLGENELSSSLQAQRDHFLTNTGKIAISTFSHVDQASQQTVSELTVILSHDLLNAIMRYDHSIAEQHTLALQKLKSLANTRARQAIEGTLALSYYALGELEAASRAVDEFDFLNDAKHILSIGCQIEVSKVLLLSLTGQWDEAVEYSQDILWYMDHHQTNISAGLVKSLVANILIDRGETRQALSLIEGPTPPIQTMLFHLANSSDMATLRSGEVAKARASLENRVGSALKDGFAETMPIALDLLVEACLADDDRPAAQRWASEAEALARKSHSSLRKITALLVRSDAFEDAAAALEAVDLAKRHRLLLHQGRAHLLAGRFGDEPQVHLHAAFQIFEQLKATPWKQKTAQQMRNRRIASPRKQVESDSGLTESETSIIRLVAQGFTNKEIAAALHYSIKTIEVYLTRVYLKTNCRSRLDLARAIDNGEVILPS